MITFGACLVPVFSPGNIINKYIDWNLGLAIACLVINIVVLLLINCTSYGKKSPINYILLFIFTITFTIPVMAICSYSREYVLLAIGLTVAVCLTLTLYAIFSKTDFTMIGGGLAIAIVILFVLSILALFAPKDYYKPV